MSLVGGGIRLRLEAPSALRGGVLARRSRDQRDVLSALLTEPAGEGQPSGARADDDDPRCPPVYHSARARNAPYPWERERRCPCLVGRWATTPKENVKLAGGQRMGELQGIARFRFYEGRVEDFKRDLLQ